MEKVEKSGGGAPSDLRGLTREALLNFSRGNDFAENAEYLLNTLGYASNRKMPFKRKDFAEFENNFLQGGHTFNTEKALANDWNYFDILFQLSDTEISNQNNLWDNKQVENTIINSYLFIAIGLKENAYARSHLTGITREINKVFPMPVMLLFQYGGLITLSVIHRRINKKESGKDVLEKVTLIKDISINNPHRAHIEILFDLSFMELNRANTVTNFVELHNAWRKTLDTEKLNKKFYADIFHWYEWCCADSRFPEGAGKNVSLSGAENNNLNIIRLITRIIFVWFIKQKNLIPEWIFNREILKTILKNFNAEDKNMGNYYNAVLQNLFFATLNKAVKERGFADENNWEKEYGIKTVYRDKKDDTYFIISKEEFVNHFSETPFLNGGLFECLDKREGKEDQKYSDGFSREKERCAFIPNILFFDKEKGLISILEKYKFTVEENTPVDIDVALDPELLGKVFENLLGTYNPETSSSARKESGSFYTPREIVDYMVDTSFKEYFKNKLSANYTDLHRLDEKLDALIQYGDDPHGFDDAEKEILITAIDNCKIFDPACGSGAFPMGALNKLVYILGKLDPENKYWRELQKKKAESAVHNTLDIKKKEERVLKLKEIDDIFELNQSGYGRKLYLIENCIYGADIQAIAIQISKLRFFISLIIEQKTDREKENFGVRPLPNLETKFVAADTLLGVKKEKGVLQSPEIGAAQDALLSVRHKHFSAKTAEEKKELREKDKEVSQKLAEILKKDGFYNSQDAEQLARWNPYDQNAVSAVFDPYWMFGADVKNGFDIIIGNPPYGANISANDKNYFRENYESAKTISGVQKGSLDTFTLFIEKGYNYNKLGGNVHFIVPIAITSSDSMTGVHRLLESSCSTIKFSSYSVAPQPIFINAVVNTSILFFAKDNKKCEHIFSTKMYRKNNRFNLEYLLSNLQFIDVKDVKLNGRYPKISLPIEKQILKNIFACDTKIGGIIKNEGKAIYYRTTGGRYYKVITNYSTGSTKEKPIYFENNIADAIGALLSSNLFFWFYQIISNNLDLKLYEIESFGIPLKKFTPDHIKEIENLYADYLIDIERNCEIRTSSKTSRYMVDNFRWYKIGKSKPLIDKIDDLICPLYGLTKEETDFIKNYEIEFRLSDAE